MSIIVENLTKVYGTQKAVDHISFEIYPGKIVGFLGPNGAGKSTTMKILSCFIPQTDGKATVCGYDVVGESMKVRENIGYLPENNPLYLEMYVKEYLKFTMGFYNLGVNKNTRIAEVIEQTGLGPEQKKKIGQLSKGYRQRVGLAQAMIHDPKVLILDEPTTGLDPNQIVDIRNLIRELGKEKTVMLSTHIMQEVQAICDRAIIINNGKIVADDATENLSSKFSKSIRIKIEFKTAPDIEEIRNLNHILSAEGSDNNVVITTANDIEAKSSIFEFCKKKDLVLLEMQKEEQNLENVFQELTK